MWRLRVELHGAVEVIETGLRANLRLAHGGVLAGDHGLLHYLVSFDADGEFLGLEVGP